MSRESDIPIFHAPEKCIRTKKQMNLFSGSESERRFVHFIQELNTSVIGTKNGNIHVTTKSIQALLDILNQLEIWVSEISPTTSVTRYGNVAFRSWLAHLEKNSNELLSTLLPPSMQDAKVELIPYILQSFGDPSRIDYGTGHELNFVALMYCLYSLGIFVKDDFSSLVNFVFKEYVKLVRKLQRVYRLEPAGSRGVWGLDDYTFLSFYWGAAQLVGHFSPNSVRDEKILKENSDDFLYFSSIKYIKEMKSGPLSETAPILYDISFLPTWKKINSGLLKMFKAECLGNFLVMQHFLFGSIITLEPK
jgi:serine/threonine-protein phosphatase 2A activator|mmetsp:Transcript_8737/g.28096  ORF Transcript_8737/g.28096 Transcript_8737/m.28096 type:complete len:306 (-) Transcript_8737:1268-2185(-)|eukprot:GHVU01169232.1.p1 GENE.GHVU01169232.1~~GHVU01169232.1.p1  ORF type:complete len:306 (+),score=14.34 GHVU01169232.1:178-1095(+)